MDNFCTCVLIVTYENTTFLDCDLKFHFIAYWLNNYLLLNSLCKVIICQLFLAVEHKVNMQVLEQSGLIMNTMAMATERYIYPVSVLFFFFLSLSLSLSCKCSSVVVVLVDSEIWA